MDQQETASVSKGCFVYKNEPSRAGKKPISKRLKSGANPAAVSSLLGSEVTKQPFYIAYTECWRQFESHLGQLQQQSNAQTLDSLVDYVTKDCRLQEEEEIIPTAALLTGINQPDHLNQFEILTGRLQEQNAARVAILQSRDCSNLKSAVENMVFNLIENQEEGEGDSETESTNLEEERDRKRLRRSQCTMKQLVNWYLNNFGESTEKSKRKLLVVILPDFECLNAAVLQDFILILSSYCGRLPFVLVLGVATSITAVHSTLPYHVSSKINLRVFQTQQAPVCLNQLLEKVVLSPKYVFRLSGKAFKFLTHIFLYYDFSIQGFIQGFKYCLMEHYFLGNAYSLCTGYAQALTQIKSLTHDDVETIRRLPSFRPYVEEMTDCRRVIAILTDDDYLKKKLPQLLRDNILHFMVFRCCLEFFTELVGDLPRCPLGKLRRELYVHCLNRPVSQLPEFKECWQMLAFLSKGELVAKITKCITATEAFLENEIISLELGEACRDIIRPKIEEIKQLLTAVITATNAPLPAKEAVAEKSSTDLSQVSSRHELKAQLLQRTQLEKQQQQEVATEYAQAQQQLLQHIETQLIEEHLKPLAQAPPLHELYVFSDISTVRRNIIGAPRAALHTALQNPHFYLQCKCCELQEPSQLVSTLPDLSVAYKLHLECGRMINLFDWLQAFRSVVSSGDEADQEQVDPQIQARFTRAVAELQFLGYIKMSKRKTDHVTRLTW